MGRGSKKMPMMRLKDEDYEKVEEMAVSETVKQGKIVPVSEMMKIIIEDSYQRFTKSSQKIVKGTDEKGANS